MQEIEGTFRSVLGVTTWLERRKERLTLKLQNRSRLFPDIAYFFSLSNQSQNKCAVWHGVTFSIKEKKRRHMLERDYVS